MTSNDSTAKLRRLARLHGVQTSYIDAAKRVQDTSEEALLRVLQALGAPLSSPEESGDAIRARRVDLWQRRLPPVTVAWQDNSRNTNATVIGEVRLASGNVPKKLPAQLKLESGESRIWSVPAEHLTTRRTATVEGTEFVACRFQVRDVPLGYHDLTIEIDGDPHTTRLIVAPVRAYEGWLTEQARPWGVFVPMYCYHRERSWGAADFTDLGHLMDWVAKQGGSMVATLPLMPTFAEVTEDPSPYSPASRLFWNEFYLDVARLPELELSPTAPARLKSPELAEALTALRGERLLDHAHWMSLKRELIGEAARVLFEDSSTERRARFEAYLAERPDLVEYAQFRALGEEHGLNWRAWPEPLASGKITPGTYDESAYRYHAYAQWQAAEQLERLIEHAAGNGMTWYLDLPLGVNGDSYDVWRYRDVFALDAAGGAPPDIFFTRGQNWGFPPIHPHRSAETGHAYFARTIRRQLEYAGLLRLDHFMQVHRLYWVPHGLEATNGAYVRYPAEELYAILTLESHRYSSGIVGENLGTVPPAVEASLERHAIHGMYVVQYELGPEPGSEPRMPEKDEVASINSHDMPPLASFWQATDVDNRFDLGLLTAEQGEEERVGREQLRQNLTNFLRQHDLLDSVGEDATLPEVLKAVLGFLAGSDASVVLVNLEDLWLETEPQNTPGTWKERPNWRLRAKYTAEEWEQMAELVEILQFVNRKRRKQDKPVVKEAKKA